MTDNRTVGARKPLIFRLGAVRWCLRHALSDGDVADLRRERGISVEHTTLFRWVQRSAPERDRSCLCCVSGRYPTDKATAVPDPYPPPRVSHRGTYLVGFMRFGEEGPGRSGRELGRHGLDSGITHPHFWGIWVGLPVLSQIFSYWPFPEGQRAMPLVWGSEIGYDRVKVSHILPSLDINLAIFSHF
jgi:hypothetical protein